MIGYKPAFFEAWLSSQLRYLYATAALEGSSFYDLPQWMHWFSANIGFHHIHHLDATIPNYNLQRCMREHPGLTLDLSFDDRYVSLVEQGIDSRVVVAATIEAHRGNLR